MRRPSHSPLSKPAVWCGRLLAAGGLLLGNLAAQAGEVSVAVAANFALPMQQIAARFEAETGHRARLAIGSTGRFYAQIRNGAPFQLLLAADAQTPARLEAEGLGVPGTRQRYATGRLALWTKASGPGADPLATLKSDRFDKLALADPKLAPYGAAAVQTLQALGLLEAVRPKLVQGESIAQAYQFVASGNAQLGFVALSQVHTQLQPQPQPQPQAQAQAQAPSQPQSLSQTAARPPPGSIWLVPEALHQPIAQEALLLLPGRDSAAAQALLQYLLSDAARAIIREHGYGL